MKNVILLLYIDIHVQLQPWVMKRISSDDGLMVCATVWRGNIGLKVEEM